MPMTMAKFAFNADYTYNDSITTNIHRIIYSAYYTNFKISKVYIILLTNAHRALKLSISIVWVRPVTMFVPKM